MFRGHVSRAACGLAAPKSRSTRITPSKGGVTKHYGGGAVGIGFALQDHARCLVVWRGWQRTHMKSNGWADVAYTLCACQHGYLLAGRGAGVRTAANGTDRANDAWYAIVFMIGGNEKPTVDALDAFDAGVRMLRGAGGGNAAGPGVNSHRDHKATQCAGTWLQSYDLGERGRGEHPPIAGAPVVVRPVVVKPAPTRPAPKPAPAKSTTELAREVIAGKHGQGDARKRSLGKRYAAVQAEVNRIVNGTPPKPKGLPSPLLTPAQVRAFPVLSRGDRGASVRNLQRLLVRRGYDIGSTGPSRDGVDESFGPATDRAAKDWQRKRMGVSTKSGDYGKVGPKTIGSLNV